MNGSTQNPISNKGQLPIDHPIPNKRQLPIDHPFRRLLMRKVDNVIGKFDPANLEKPLRSITITETEVIIDDTVNINI